MSFRDGVSRLANRTEREMNALFARYERGQIDREDFVALSAALLARARVQGVALADLALTAEVIKQQRRRTVPLGLTPPAGDYERLQVSVDSVLTDDVDYEGEELQRSRLARLGRLARDSSAEAAVWGYGVGMQERGARGWVRQTDVDPCPVCIGLADGVVRSPSVMMKRHKGCACVPAAAF